MLGKKYGHSAAGTLLWRWAGGAGATEGDEDGHAGKSVEQVRAEEEARTTQTVREGVLWFLRRGLEGAASVQRGMVEKRIERVREKEKSVLYKSAGQKGVPGDSYGSASASAGPTGPAGPASAPSLPTPDAAVLSEADSAQIESQLSAEQLQLFAEENDSMLRHYEDTLGKVQYVYSFRGFCFQLENPVLVYRDDWANYYFFSLLQKRREIPHRNLLATRNARIASRDAGGIHLTARQRRRYDADECRAGKSRVEARDRAPEYGAGGILGDGRVVYVVGGLGFGVLRCGSDVISLFYLPR